MRKVDKTKQKELVNEAMLELREWCRKYDVSIEGNRNGEASLSFDKLDGCVETYRFHGETVDCEFFWDGARDCERLVLDKEEK